MPSFSRVLSAGHVRPPSGRALRVSVREDTPPPSGMRVPSTTRRATEVSNEALRSCLSARQTMISLDRAAIWALNIVGFLYKFLQTAPASTGLRGVAEVLDRSHLARSWPPAQRCRILAQSCRIAKSVAGNAPCCKKATSE